ncbi:MAG: DUF3795 domain-containing protein [Lachnospiraceae bacterium]|nr:DUF3795 domain-containing protein [Lachnospiraceae bacterium]
MNKEWSEKNKKMQVLIGKKASFEDGIAVLIELREDLFGQITSIVNTYPLEAFSKMPYGGAKGYHSKTLSYSMWHIFRIEDIVAHTLILKDSQVLFTEDWQKRINSPSITTGNELKGEEIAEFSAKLDVRALYDYCRAVMDSTNELLKDLQYNDLKRKFTDDDRERIIETGSVSKDEDAFWLIDYWCGKDVKGLIQMPFSRHWIMHIEAMCRIKNELCRKARKGVDPIAFCGLSCNHCFLKEWCGGCRTSYNTCSYATCSSDRICPNAACCKEKTLDGCYDCDRLAGCLTGFYSNGNDANAVKAMAMFIRKHGKKELAAVLDNLHKKHDFQKIQEILGADLDEGLKILEENR